MTKLFLRYLSVFETEFIPKGIKSGVFGKSWLISIRPGRLSKTRYGMLLGDYINSEISFAIDYYGYIKKSNGLLNVINEKLLAIKGRQLKKVQSTMIHFAAIKIEDITEITKDPFIITKFPEFKKVLLMNRGYKNGNSRNFNYRTVL